MTRASGISNRLTPESEREDRAAHPPQDAPPNTAGDAPNAVAGAFGDGEPTREDDTEDDVLADASLEDEPEAADEPPIPDE